MRRARRKRLFYAVRICSYITRPFYLGGKNDPFQHVRGNEYVKESKRRLEPLKTAICERYTGLENYYGRSGGVAENQKNSSAPPSLVGSSSLGESSPARPFTLYFINIPVGCSVFAKGANQKDNIPFHAGRAVGEFSRELIDLRGEKDIRIIFTGFGGKEYVQHLQGVRKGSEAVEVIREEAKESDGKEEKKAETLPQPILSIRDSLCFIEGCWQPISPFIEIQEKKEEKEEKEENSNSSPQLVQGHTLSFAWADAKYLEGIPPSEAPYLVMSSDIHLIPSKTGESLFGTFNAEATPVGERKLSFEEDIRSKQVFTESGQGFFNRVA